MIESQGRCAAIVHSLLSILPSPLLLFPSSFRHNTPFPRSPLPSPLLISLPFPLLFPTLSAPSLPSLLQRSLPPLSSLNSFPPPLPFPSSSRFFPSPCSLFILSPNLLILLPCPLHHSAPYSPYPLLFPSIPLTSHPLSSSPISTPPVIAPLLSSPFFPSPFPSSHPSLPHPYP